MVFAAAFLTILGAVLPPSEPLRDDKDALGDKKVTMKEAWFFKGPSRISGTLRKAEDGEDVTVSAVDGKYSKVTAKWNIIGCSPVGIVS